MVQKKRTFWRTIVRYSFKSLEQCISYAPVNEDTSYDSRSFSEENQSYQIRGWSCEPNNQLNVCTTSVTEGEVGPVKLV